MVQIMPTILSELSIDVPDENRITPFYNGMITCFACKNARTGEIHIERDCSYTLIAVPFHDHTIPQAIDYCFEFVFNEISKLQVRLESGVILYYNGFGILHRQMKCGPTLQNNVFWNLSTYSNKALYECILKSFRRRTHSHKWAA